MLKLAFGKKVFLIITGVAAFSAIMVAIPSIINTNNGVKTFAVSDARADTRLVASMSGPAVLFNADDLAVELLKLLAESEHFVAAIIYVLDEATGNYRVFTSYGDFSGTFPVPDILPYSTEILAAFEGDFVRTVGNIYAGNEKVGLVQIVTDLSYVGSFVDRTMVFVAVAFSVSIFVALYLAGFFRRIIVSPITELNETAKEITKTRDYSRRAIKHNDDELGELTSSFNNMLSVIQKINLEREQKESEILTLNETLEHNVFIRTMELEQNMQVLRKTVDDLKKTQRKLAEQEKMASLGSLVSGVAHEINTPLGVAITASSYLTQTADELFKLFNSGTLTKKDFSDAMSELVETNMMVSKNLERAAALVKSFKMVAVDQTNEDVRSFDIKDYIESVLLSLAPKFKRTTHQVIIEAPENLMVNSSPGALSQVLTNLLMNSLIHGFEDRQNGVVRIVIRQIDDLIHLDYFDNGKGVDPSIRDRIFDPFVTTARHKGGSGLGTHIVYNLVHQVLGGSLSLMGDTKQGVHFAIEFPIDVTLVTLSGKQVSI